jgi:hypothetical protein
MTKREEKEKKLEEEINKKLDEKIDEVLEEGLGPEFDKIVKSKVQEKLREKVGQDVDLKLEQKAKDLAKTENGRSAEEKEELKVSENASPISKIFSEFKADFHLCWKGSCRTISLITLIGYFFIAFLLIGCHFSNICGFASKTTISAAIFLALIILVATSLVISVFSKYPRTALVFWVLLDIPLLILVLIFTAQFVALIIILIVLLMRFIQVLRGEY